VAAVCLLLGFHLQEASAQKVTMEDYALAAKSFADGDFASAAETLEIIIGSITDTAEKTKLAPHYYMLGASYYNLSNFPKSIEAFTTFLSRFPNDRQAPQVKLGMARSKFLNKDYEEAAKMFEVLEAFPTLRDEALGAQADCYQFLERPDDQIRVIEKLIQPEIKTRHQASGAVNLAQLYLGKKDTSKALELLTVLNSKLELVDNLIGLNTVTIGLGDELVGQRAFVDALDAYRGVRTKDQVIAFQKDRISSMDERMKANLERAKANPDLAIAATSENTELKTRKEEAEKMLKAFEELADFWPTVLLRMGNAWYESGKKWEALVVFARVLSDYPDRPESEQALYSSIICTSDLKRIAKTMSLCDTYQDKYPDGANAAAVCYMAGTLAVQNNDLDRAIRSFKQLVETHPQSDFTQEARFLLGNVYFLKQELAEARKTYQNYVKDFPEGSFVQEALYRDALTLIFLGNYDESAAAFKDYLKKFPHGTFASDASYRILLCAFAGRLYDEVIAGVAKWEKDFPDDPITGDVLALLGDCLVAVDRNEEAARAYIRAYETATSDDVMNYALFEAGSQLRKQGKWDEVSLMFENFVAAEPDHPSVIAAMYWIGKAKAREGKTEEAIQLIVEKLKPYFNDPRREAVEPLLQQVAQLCVKRPQAAPPAEPAPEADPAAPAVPEPAPAPLPPYDAMAEMTKRLAPLKAIAQGTGEARLLYVQAELLKLTKREAETGPIWTQIASAFRLEDLSPILLNEAGIYRLNKGDLDSASEAFELLRKSFPKSEYIDSAYVGLGEVALQKKDPEKALTLFNYASNEVAGNRMKDATVGVAKAQFELNKLDEAKKGFEAIASTREWRGESTALSVYYLGEIEAKQGNLPAAIAHYQRVFVAYQKYLTWVSKSYIRSAEAFDKLGQRPEAIAHLREMLRDDELKFLPEAKQATKMLSDWGAS